MYSIMPVFLGGFLVKNEFVKRAGQSVNSGQFAFGLAVGQAPLILKVGHMVSLLLVRMD